MAENDLPLISIIMPVHNCEAFIEAAIMSAINQTYTAFELIVIDDKSTDGSVEIVKNIQLSDKRIKILTNETNLGVSLSRKIGIEKARGEWVAFLDSDDLWSVDKLAKQIKLLKRERAELSFTGSRFIDESGNPYNYIMRVPARVTYKQLLFKNIISCSSVIVNKELIKRFPMGNEKASEDYVAWLKILKKGYAAIGINEPLLTYRIRKGSRSRNKIQAALKTYYAYREVGISVAKALAFTLRYAFYGITKYSKIQFVLKADISKGNDKL